MPRSQGISFIVHLYLHFLCSCFLRVFAKSQVFLLNTNNLHTVVFFQLFHSNIDDFKKGDPLVVMAKVRNCDLVVNEFQLQLPYCVYFWTNTIGKGGVTPYSLS